MKRFTRIVCMILVLATALAIPASAVEIANQRGSSYFAKYSVYLEKASGSQFKIWFDVTALDVMSKLGASEITVERSSDQVNWTPMQTYYKAYNSQMVASNRGSYANYVTYTYTSGYYYRATITLYAKNSSGSAESTVTTTTEYF